MNAVDALPREGDLRPGERARHDTLTSRAHSLDRRGLTFDIRRVLKLILLISKGLIRDQRSRRTVMFYGTLAALIVLFLGATLLDRWLRDRPFAFLAYWAACAWITILCVLLAIFDLLLVRAAARRERRRIEQEYLRRIHDDDDSQTS